MATSSTVKNRWKKKTYYHMDINLRKVEDKELIDYIEKRKANGEQPTEIFRQMIKKELNK